MEMNEIKKALYKEKPIATKHLPCSIMFESNFYTTDLKDGTRIVFEIPNDEYDPDKFSEDIPAQLLIRWIRSQEDIDKLRNGL